MLKKNNDRLLVGGLLLLALVPLVAGVARVFKVGVGDGALENARFLANPIPIVLHVVSASLYSLIGAFQFAPSLRSKWPRWHRRAGRLLVVLGVVVAMTGIWMTLFYPVANQDTTPVFIARLLVGLMMLSFTALGVEAIRQKKYDEHGNWMIRTYALAMGAGTQVFTHLPQLVFSELAGELSRSISMILAWLVNAAVAEWIISRSKGDFSLRAKFSAVSRIR